MKPTIISIRRRRFLRSAMIATPGVAATLLINPAVARADNATASSAPYAPQYFSTTEFGTLNALADRLIPADQHGPSASEAGVIEFLDRQMQTPYGRGELWYMDGPHDPSASGLFGYQLKYPPSELYRIALREFAAEVNHRYSKAFIELTSAEQDKIVALLEKDDFSMSTVPAIVFFSQLLANVHEGYFCDPIHGGNKQMAAWKMIGFPGARADYMDWVNQYGERYPLPPISLA